MQQANYQLARAGSIETDPLTFSDTSGVFSSEASGKGTSTPLIERNDSFLDNHPSLPKKSLGCNASQHPAPSVGARAELAELPENPGNSPTISEPFYRRSPVLREAQPEVGPTVLTRLQLTPHPHMTPTLAILGDVR